MDKRTVGLLAHVDAGKTTLSEAMLYTAGAVRKLGRVDHRDAFLDTDAMERERGITIFSKQAILRLGETELTLLDTPGHADLTAETQRVLGVLDCAVLVVSAPDGVQGHTLTLWKLLERAGVPTVLFLNKMDQPVPSRGELMEHIKARLGEGCVDWEAPGFWEEAALGDEEALGEYLETERLSEKTLRRLIGERKLFPCLFGSALKLEGVDRLLDTLCRYIPKAPAGEDFSARVFKITRDGGTRLTHLKVTGGSLRVKDTAAGEKVDQIRLYSGARFTTPEIIGPGTVCAVTGLTGTYPGQALGAEPPWVSAPPEPALSYDLILPEGVDPHGAWPKLKELGEEDPQLHLEWSEALGRVKVRLMGTVQAEILQRLIFDRFGWQVTFGPGSILYKETIAEKAEGVGHFEPLRHYAEVHLLLEPLPLGSGVELASACPEDVLAVNWQRLILTHLAERVHPGVLTGSPLTDVRITLLTGRAHEKHTEGGDFRQATYRAVRQGLMGAKNVLLEPWYAFRLELPGALMGRAMGDIQRMGGECEPPQTVGEETILTGAAPVAGLRDYAKEVAAYSRGHGRLTLEGGGYRPCNHQEAAVEALGYDPERDTANPAGSVFCSHGAGHEVPWQEVPKHAHLPMLDTRTPGGGGPAPARRPGGGGGYSGSLEADKELMGIFERTYGAVKPRAFQETPKAPARRDMTEGKVELKGVGPERECLLVDGYNMIFAWEELKALAGESLDDARKQLMDILSDYRGYRKNEIVLVFDAYKVPGGVGAEMDYHGLRVVYTKENETADSWIERNCYALAKEGRRVRVATSDAAEQYTILGHALRMSAQELRGEIRAARGEIRDILRRSNIKLPAQPLKAAMEKAEEEKW